jgi:hypothetical protein
MGEAIMRTDVERRLPAYGRQVRANLNAGKVPALCGNTIAVCVGWPAHCIFAHVVCVRDERSADQWDFDFLAGMDAIVWFDRRDLTYAEEVRLELLKAGCPIVAMLQLPEGES